MIKLALCEDIYSEKKIKQVMQVYKDYAQIKLKKEESKYILEFKNCKYDKRITIQEFENYLIGMENVRNGMD